MKNASFRQKLLTSFLAIGILPLLICTLLMLNIFRLSLTRSAAAAQQRQRPLDAQHRLPSTVRCPPRFCA